MQAISTAAFAAAIRKDIVEMVGKAGSGHPGGSLSIADILAVLYTRTLSHKPETPDWSGRDRLILSKGHAAPALYAALAEAGYFDRSLLGTFRDYGSPLQGHPDKKKLAGVEMSTGSLGQGLSIAGGIALGLRAARSASKVYAILGDGEIQEGQIWEAAMAIAHYRLSNVIAVVDNNNLQIDGTVEQVMNVYPIEAKFVAFGWNVLSIDGHDLARIEAAFAAAGRSDKPTVIVAKTVKGKGVDYMENKREYHHASNLAPELVASAVAQIDAKLKESVHA